MPLWTQDRAPLPPIGPVAQILEFTREESGYLLLRRSISFDARRRPVLERSYDEEGILIMETRRIYGKSGLLAELLGTDVQGAVSFRYRYIRDESGRLVEEQVWDGSGQMESRTLHSYSENARIHKIAGYDRNAVVKLEESWQYDEKGLPVSRMLLFSDRKLLKRELYYHDSRDRIVVVERYDAKGLYEREEFMYDERDALSGTKTFTADNSLKERVRFFREADGRINEEFIYGPDGEIRGKREYQYDSYGNWVSKRERDGLILFREYVYYE